MNLSYWIRIIIQESYRLDFIATLIINFFFKFSCCPIDNIVCG